MGRGLSVKELATLLYGLFSIVGLSLGQNVTGISDPIADILPLKPTLEYIDPTNNNSSEYFESTGGINRPESKHSINQQPLANASQDRPVDGALGMASGSPSIKRHTNSGQITVTSHLQENERLQPEDEDTRTGGKDCSYTFFVPRMPEISSNICARSCVSQPPQGDQSSTSLRQDVLDVKSRFEEIRNEMLNGREGVSASAIEAVQRSVSLLQQESRNMDSRVSQLYKQLLHEIIHKRDDSLELQQMENKILNYTVKYYKLKAEHEELKRSQASMMEQIQDQAQQLAELKRAVGALQPQQRDFMDPLLETENLRQQSSTRRKQVVSPTSPLSPTTRALRSGPYRDCTEAQRAGLTRSGMFNLRIPGYRKRIRVWCDFDQDPGGWIVIQRRTGRRINFYRNMAAYKAGFRRPHSDFWLGLERIHQLTTREGVNFKLHIDLEDWNDKMTFVEYQSFRVEGEDTGYRLKVTHYSGNAGDSLTWHNNMRFTTSDQDNDPFEGNCANYQRGGWWYNTCASSNLNGIYYKGGHYRSQYQDGMYWSDWRGKSYSLKSVSMKIMPTE